jgi:AcrR family transcriptional regulator
LTSLHVAIIFGFVSKKEIGNYTTKKRSQRLIDTAQAERTRRNILDTALKLLWSNAFRDLTVAGLTTEAGISRPCFYQYFADLHNLMENLHKDLGQKILSFVQPWLAVEENPVLELAETLSGVVKVCHESGPLIRAIVEAAPWMSGWKMTGTTL